MTRRSVHARGSSAIVLIATAAAFGACARAPRPAARTTPTDSSRVSVRPPDTTTRRDTALAAVKPPIAAAPTDTPRTAARPRRRNANDPTSRCGTVTLNNPPVPTSHLTSYQDAANNYINYIGGGANATCSGVKNRLRADSAEYYETNGQLILINNVVYDEPKRAHMTSNRLTYFTKEERILAEGNVVVTLPSGTTMTGPNVEYLRDAPALRDRTKLTATGRPTLRVISVPERDSAAARTASTTAARDTATIIANTIVDDGDSVVFASGSVEVVRTDVRSKSDSATFDQGTEIARLINNAEIRGQRGRPFTLAGARIDLFSRDRELTRVRAQGAGHVVSEDIDLKSDTIDLRVRESRIERAFAWGPSRARAVSPERDVTADSIDALLPNQRIRELHAVGHALVRSLPDSTKIISKERDLLGGDTIIARFDSLVAAQDTTKNPPVRQIVATGNALSLSQIAASGGRTEKHAFNYVLGRVITAAFDSGQLQGITVLDSVRGIYLEPDDSTADSVSTRAQRGRSGTRPSTPARPPQRRPESEPSAIARPRDGERVFRTGPQ